MAQGRKSTGPGGLSPETILIFVGVGLFAVVVGGMWGALKIAAGLNGTRPVGDPIDIDETIMLSAFLRCSSSTMLIFCGRR